MEINGKKPKLPDSVEKHKSCIHNVPIFSTLNEDEMFEVLMTASHQSLKKGETIYTEGDNHKKMFVINKGKVKISKISKNGKEQIIRILGKGDFTGELSLFNEEDHKSRAEAVENTSICLVESDKIKELMEKNSKIAIKILSEMSKRLEETENLIETIGLKDVDEKVSSLLLDLSKGSNIVNLDMTKKDLAAHIQITPETLSRRLSSYEDMNIIKQNSFRRITILDRDALKSFSN